MLEMNLDGTELKFEVKKYHPSTKNNWDCEWCQIFVSVHSKYIHYEMDGETFIGKNRCNHSITNIVSSSAGRWRINC